MRTDLFPLKKDSYLNLTKVYYHTALGSARYVLHLQETKRVMTAYGAKHVTKTRSPYLSIYLSIAIYVVGILCVLTKLASSVWSVTWIGS
jgi:hypothetical protein